MLTFSLIVKNRIILDNNKKYYIFLLLPQRVNIYKREIFSRIISFFQESINTLKKTSRWRSSSEIFWALPPQTKIFIATQRIPFINLLNQMISKIWEYNSLFHGAKAIDNITVSAKEILLSLEESEENKNKFVELIFKLIPNGLLDLSKRKNSVVQVSDLLI